MSTFRCSVPGCGYMAAIPAWQLDEVAEVHISHHKEQAARCTCFGEPLVLDPFCSVHAREAVR